jgi:hypothetical protein
MKDNPLIQQLSEMLRFDPGGDLSDKLQSLRRQSDLWRLMTALRGPDYTEMDYLVTEEIKSSTTGVIRYAFLKLGDPSIYDDGRSDIYGAIINPDSQAACDMRIKLARNANHFINHARSAFLILGLKWDEVNPK